MEETVSTAQSRKMFVNLSVRDLDRSVAFFTALGLTFDERFTDDEAACLIISDEAFVMLLVEERFEEFTTKAVCDATTHTEAILALSADSRPDVDVFADRALAGGGQPANDPMDMEFMYGRSFYDPDGHLWEVFHMDPSALEE
jgi:predicted lactoylglutathione lyase